MSKQGSQSRIRLVTKKTQRELAEEWDRIARRRLEQVEKHVDLSRDFVLLPAISGLLPEGFLGRVIDVGCGSGQLTAILSGRARHAVGVDPSRESIRLAEECYGTSAAGLIFVASTIEEYASRDQEPFDVAVANMVLMTVPDLDAALVATSSLLRGGGTFVFTITHPWFWPSYWGYDYEPWFTYTNELFIEAPFEISLDEALDVTTHVHRPLEAYFTSLFDSGLVVERCLEPMPPPGVHARYPKPWKFPRFFAASCRRTPT